MPNLLLPLPLVVIESPYSGDIEGNTAYLHRALRHSIDSGENPYASHRMFPGILDEYKEHERELGMRLGYGWAKHAEAFIFYMDRGFSDGMKRAMMVYAKFDNPIIARWIDRPGDHKELGEYKTLVDICQAKSVEGNADHTH